MTRSAVVSTVLLALVGLALAGSLPAAGGQLSAAPQRFPLYSAGERVDGIPLAAVLRREDTADFVSFIYGDCVASDDAGCAPPVEIQVWPACRRNLALYGAGDAAGPPLERIIVRGVPALLFDEGTRLELETGRATVVVFGGTRARVLRIVTALRAIDETVLPGRPFPLPTRGQEGGTLDC